MPEAALERVAMISFHYLFRLCPLLLLTGLLLLAGCSTTPEVLRGTAQQEPDPAQVRAAPGRHIGATVRWGGIIAAVDNGPTESVIQIVARPLSRSGRPLETDASAGRFLLRIDGFVDPVVYANGRELTAVGHITGVEQRNIGAYPYSYPVLHASSHHLWALRPPPAPEPFYYPPYPYHRPWYPYGPYPYWP